MKKQLLAILLIASVIFTFCGCKDGSDSLSSLSTTMSNIPESSSEVSTSFVSSTQSIESQSFDNHSSSSDSLSSNSHTSKPTNSLASRYKYFAEGKSSHTMVIGETKRFSTSIPPLPIGGFSTRYSYKTSDETVIKLALGDEKKELKDMWGCTIVALKPGTATLTGTWSESGQTFSKSCTITVLSDYPDSMKNVVFIADDPIKVMLGDTRKIEFLYSKFFTIEDTDYQQPEFEISDETIVEKIFYEKKDVSYLINFFDDVYIFARSPGTVTLTVTAYDNGKAFTDTCTIIVEDPVNAPDFSSTSYPASSS